MGSVPLSPDHTIEMAIPLLAKPRCVFPQHCLQRAIKPLNQAVALGVVGCGIELADPQCLAHIRNEIGQEVGTPVREQTLRHSILGCQLCDGFSDQGWHRLGATL